MTEREKNTYEKATRLKDICFLRGNQLCTVVSRDSRVRNDARAHFLGSRNLLDALFPSCAVTLIAQKLSGCTPRKTFESIIFLVWFRVGWVCWSLRR